VVEPAVTHVWELGGDSKCYDDSDQPREAYAFNVWLYTTSNASGGSGFATDHHFNLSRIKSHYDKLFQVAGKLRW
jgi:hypothetical protein